jgi:hypothetical protein
VGETSDRRGFDCNRGFDGDRLQSGFHSINIDNILEYRPPGDQKHKPNPETIIAPTARIPCVSMPQRNPKKEREHFPGKQTDQISCRLRSPRVETTPPRRSPECMDSLTREETTDVAQVIIHELRKTTAYGALAKRIPCCRYEQFTPQPTRASGECSIRILTKTARCGTLT